MADIKQTRMTVRVLHGVFVYTWFMFVLVLYFLRPVPHTVGLMVVGAFAFGCITDIAIALYFRSQFIAPAAEALGKNPWDAPALQK